MQLSATIRILVAAATLTLISSAWAEEQLANPFGGQAPEYSPGGYIESWSGTHNGYERSFDLFLFDDAKIEQVSIYSWKRREFCFLEARERIRYTQNRLYIPPAIGGCWLMKTPGEQYDYMKNLGGVRYGPFDCKIDAKKGRGICNYTAASTGKTSSFSIKKN